MLCFLGKAGKEVVEVAGGVSQSGWGCLRLGLATGVTFDSDEMH